MERLVELFLLYTFVSPMENIFGRMFAKEDGGTVQSDGFHVFGAFLSVVVSGSRIRAPDFWIISVVWIVLPIVVCFFS